MIDNKNKDTILSDDSLSLEEDLDIVKEKDLDIVKENDKPRGIKRKLKDEENGLHELKKKRTLTDLLREKEGYISESESCESPSENEQFDELNEESGDSHSICDNVTDTEQEENSSNVTDKLKKPKVWEDIYGRFRDEEGNVIKNREVVQKYIPPSLRKTTPSDQKQEEILKIRKNLKGFLNRY